MFQRIGLRLFVAFVLVASVAAPSLMPSRAAVVVAASWPVEQVGSSGPLVAALQYLLLAHGRHLSVDGTFGSQTRSEVLAFQKASGIAADGVVGERTWGKLIVTVSRGRSGSAVKAVQYLLAHQYGAGIAVDGVFGPATYGAVTSFQRGHGLSVDGIVGPHTWFALLTGSGSSGGGGGSGGGNPGGDRARLARAILATGRVTFWNYHESGVRDDATAYDEIHDTAAGRPAHRSSYGTAPGGTVYLSTAMLQGVLALSHSYRLDVSEIAGGSHVATSYHYRGTAIDFARINGVSISFSNPYYRGLMSACRSLGAIEVLGPGDAGHATHVHCAWRP